MNSSTVKLCESQRKTNFTRQNENSLCTLASLLYLVFINISTANKDRSTVNYCQNFDLWLPICICDDHCDWWLFQKIFFYWYFYFLEILLNNLEHVFLEFKHIFKTIRASLFSSYLFIFCLLFCNHFVY